MNRLKNCQTTLCNQSPPVKECLKKCELNCQFKCKNDDSACLETCRQCPSCTDIRRQCAIFEKRNIIDCCKKQCKLGDYKDECVRYFCPKQDKECITLNLNRINECAGMRNRTCIGVCDRPILFSLENYSPNPSFSYILILLFVFIVVFSCKTFF